MHAHVGTVQLGLWLASGLEQDVQGIGDIPVHNL